MNIAIIGAGISGLTAASILKNYANVTIFEKSRGVGGRMSTRREGLFYFDHGAQFFTAKTDAFKSFMSAMLDQGIIMRWDARFVEFEYQTIVSRRNWNEQDPHYVAVKSMNAVAKYLAKDIDIQLNKRIATIKHNGKWDLIDDLENHVGSFDWVISSAPAEQTAELMPKLFTYHADIASSKMVGCFALMLGFTQPLPLDFDAALIRGSNISWISVNSSKPGRDDIFCLVVHSTNQWAENHQDEDRGKLMEYLCEETSSIIGYDVNVAKHKAIHYWRYANIEKQNKPLMIDAHQKLAACGDWCIQGGVEAAYTSGMNIVEYMLKII
jgi:renalase